jgi:hypothetical protein
MTSSGQSELHVETLSQESKKERKEKELRTLIQPILYVCVCVCVCVCVWYWSLNSQIFLYEVHSQ